MCYIFTIGYYLAIKNKIMLFICKRMDGTREHHIKQTAKHNKDKLQSRSGTILGERNKWKKGDEGVEVGG